MSDFEYLNLPWVIVPMNEEYDIYYLKNDHVYPVPGWGHTSEGHLRSIKLATYIVQLHNDRIKGVNR